MNTALTVNPAEVRKHIRRVGLRVDPAYRLECERWFENTGIRLLYYRPDGLTIDEMGESLWDAGLLAHRPGTVELIDLLDSQLTGHAYQTKRAGRVRVSKKAVDASEKKARSMRLRKYDCQECYQIARGTRKSDLICGKCFRDWAAQLPGDIATFIMEHAPFMRRVDPLPEEILNTQGMVTA